MKNYGPRRNSQLSEREKLRQFNELDDAFAKALRDLDASSEASSRNARRDFEKQLRDLMKDFQQSDDSVRDLLSIMLEYEAS
ncbi:MULTISPECIES: hypothetical protein [Modicisalibacter]|uniref:hypothetical protein n=1 Tax=Modicisalibacter TaxID=574347 RepID=UPI00100A6A47|nr:MULTISPECIES: hypothetical protein [Halomonadaceae]MBZ9556765.1 hypothetical protein [Modicisalibacter sp. R2A 31.J]MBZ9574766.1 hypothetical protein [Modicisalibacter sp. MOD 31.J]